VNKEQSDIYRLGELMHELISIQRKYIPKYVRVNQDYLNELINKENVISRTFSSDGDIWIDYDTKGYLGTFEGIPVIIDNSISTYEFVYEIE
jgi:hypothetical protein